MLSNFWEWHEKFFSKKWIKCPHILSTSQCATISEFPFKISAAKAIAKGPYYTHQFVFRQAKT